MINRELLNPKSIAVIGASNDTGKPGGKVLKNILDGDYRGKIYGVNPKEEEIQGIECFREPSLLPAVELAILAIAAQHIPDVVEALASQKSTRAFIVLSAGFSEEGPGGRILEERLVEIVNRYEACLIGPNCIGILTPEYHGVFTLPIPTLDRSGCDFVSGSGATACFIMENGIPKGLRFNRVFSVGNSAQTGVEEVLEYLDESYVPDESPKVKLLYLENIADPAKLLRHARSLVRKGCRIAAIKAGSSAEGSRAASSHTGALASSDQAVEALFRKAGIIRCYGRDDLINVASVFMLRELAGRRIGIITHAGGPAVMITDALSKSGFEIPEIKGGKANELLEKLYPGSSVSNPIDFLATGTAEQLEMIIDFTDRYFDEIDGMVVIFGTPGLNDIFDAYDVLDRKMKSCRKPIFPVLPSVITAKEEINRFTEKGRVYFPDEVLLAHALDKAYPLLKLPDTTEEQKPAINYNKIRKVIEDARDGYLDPADVRVLLKAAGIPLVPEKVVYSRDEAKEASGVLGFPLVMKVTGLLHKSDVGGVKLGIRKIEEVVQNFDELMRIPEATAVMLQPMVKGLELFAGAKYEDKFGHLVLFGMGGIFIETLKDFATSLSPVSVEEAITLISGLKSYDILKGSRGQEGVSIQLFGEIVAKVSLLLELAPEIMEMDLNPLIGSGKALYAVDARIRKRAGPK